MRRLLKLTDDDVVLACLPLFHVFGMTCAMNAAIAAGAGLSLMARFHPAKAIERIHRDRVTVLEAVPTMYTALLSVADQFAPDMTASLRTCVSGGAALPVAVLNDFEKTFDAVILEGYGLSETSPAMTFNHPDAERRPGSIGTPIEGVQVRLVDDDGNEVPTGSPGEIQIKGPNVMKGYWNLPEATKEAIKDGWFATGDIAVVDEDGYYYIVDRKKDLIIRGGYNVYPREIEEVLHEHPAVAEVAVIGIPHDSLGEEVGAAVMLKAGAAANGGTAAVRQGTGRRIQVSPPDLVRRHPPDGPDGKAVAPRSDTTTNRGGIVSVVATNSKSADELAAPLDLLLTSSARRRGRQDDAEHLVEQIRAQPRKTATHAGVARRHRWAANCSRSPRADPSWHPPRETSASPIPRGAATRCSSARCRRTWPPTTLWTNSFRMPTSTGATPNGSGSCWTCSPRDLRRATTRC